MRRSVLALSIYALSAGVARADPISAIIGAISAITSAISTAVGSLISFASLGAFLASPIGGLVLGIGLQLLVAPLFRQKRQAPSMEAGKVNARLPEPERWINAGLARQGGGVVFGEFDSAGNFWYLIAHSDSRHSGIVKRYFDDQEIEIDADGWVISNDFVLTPKKENYAGTGTKVPYFRIYTTTYTDGNPVAPVPAAFAAAFPGVWTSDHKLAGVTYTAIMVKPLTLEHRYKIYKWKGPIGLGEPSFSILANWSQPYDPRTGNYAFTRNTALIWAWFRIHKYGRGKSFDSINWDRIAEQADICDQLVADKDGVTRPRYQCGISIPESKERSEAEQEILTACDGQIVFDDDGKVWVRVGYYYTPTLALNRNRDIFAVESVEAQNGESETQGVIVRYMDPAANYTVQPSAPWKNPNYYVEGETPRYLTIDALAIQDHNQAFRLAKSVGLRSQSTHKLLPTCGLRGLKARQERIINFNYDNDFAGEYEIVTPVEVEKSGALCGFGIVPVNENRWVLLPGEEASKPVYDATVSTNNPVLPSGVVVSFDGTKLNVTFDPVPREDWRYEFEYKVSTEAVESYVPMSVKMTENTATSGSVAQNKTYNIRYRTVTTSGRVTDWKTPTVDVFTAIITASGTPVTTATLTVPYAGFTVSASGGATPYFFSDVFGRLPPGISINSSTGVVSGTPTTAGTYANIYLRVQDINGAFATLNPFTITVAP